MAEKAKTSWVALVVVLVVVVVIVLGAKTALDDGRKLQEAASDSAGARPMPKPK